MTTRSTNRIIAAAALALAGTMAPAFADRPYTAWLQEYDVTSTQGQDAIATATDVTGNTYTTGITRDSNGVQRIYTVKYNAADGSILWEKVYGTGSTAYEPRAIAVDKNGDVVVGGMRNAAGNIDYFLIKYNGDTGNEFWASPKTFNGTNDGQDEIVKVVTDSSANIYVTGFSAGANNGGNTSGLDIVTIKYNSAGTQQGSADTYFTAASNGDDKPTSLALDSLGRVVIAGQARVSGVIRPYVRRLTSAMALNKQIVLPTTGGDSGVLAMAVDSNDNVAITSQARTANGNAIYTAVLNESDLTVQWDTGTLPASSNFTGKPVGIALDGENNVIVSGHLANGSGTLEIRNFKYQAGGFFGGAFPLWQTADSTDTGLGFGDSLARAMAVDGSGNLVVVGESDNEDFDSDIYIARYDAKTGKRTYASFFPGSFGTDDIGVGISVDGNGGFAALGTEKRKINNTGRNGIVTIKYGRFLAYTGDEMPDDPGVPANAVYVSGNAPAIADDGSVAALVTLASGKTKLGAIFTQGTAGGTFIPAIQGGTVPNVANAKFAKFSDPLTAGKGLYTFSATITGVPGSQNMGVWSSIGGTLHLVMQKGKPVPGMTENLVSILGMTMTSTTVNALVKVSGPGTTNTALVQISSNNTGTVLARTGGSYAGSTIKKLTSFVSPSVCTGDGRWGYGNIAQATLADKRIIDIASTMTTFEAGTTSSGPYKKIGFPTASTSGNFLATLAFLKPAMGVTSANDMVIVRKDPGGMNDETILREGGTPADASLSGTTYVSFTDPSMSAGRGITTIATIKGQGVTGKNSKVLLSGTTPLVVARLGGFAPDAAGVATTATWSAFVNYASPFGIPGRPVFVAKLAGSGVNAKNNLGVWGRDENGNVRQLLRNGDVLGEETVKSFTLLKAIKGLQSNARSFNSTGGMAAQVSFNSKKQALIKLPQP